MAKLKNFLLKSSIDSFKYRIDLDKVKILDSNLLDCLITQTVNSATGEIISSKELKLNSLKPEFFRIFQKLILSQEIEIDVISFFRIFSEVPRRGYTRMCQEIIYL